MNLGNDRSDINRAEHNELRRRLAWLSSAAGDAWTSGRSCLKFMSFSNNLSAISISFWNFN